MPDANTMGFWPSPISAGSVAEGALRFGRVQIHQGTIYWSESRPTEGGRSVIVRWTADGGLDDLLPPAFSARSRVHEYGGGEFLIAGDSVFFVNDADQDIYAVPLTQSAGGEIRRITAIPETRFADFTYDARADRLIAVAESHHEGRKNGDAAALVQNVLCAVPLHWPAPLTSVEAIDARFDFYATPRLNPDGDKLAFLAWNLPSMPWDAAELHLAGVEADGSLAMPSRHLAGGTSAAGKSAAFQPQWSESGTLHFVWDDGGFGNLYRFDERTGRSEALTALQSDANLPLWSLNAATYALSETAIFFNAVTGGEEKAAILDLATERVKPFESSITATSTLAVESGTMVCTAMTDSEPLCVVTQSIDPQASRSTSPTIIRRSGSKTIDAGFVSIPSRLQFPASGGGRTYGLLYPPANAGYEQRGEKPPLIINLHGGPTTSAARGFKPRTAFFTSRGFSWLDLDYAGSTGYGRAYRKRLDGQWGTADVSDTVDAARYALDAGLAGEAALFVTGGSAGGYTVMMTVATSNVFRGATSYYGICDLAQLQRSTHKFEYGYIETLLGAKLQDNPALYADRSPLTHAAAIETPLLLFQGKDDRVVPRDQAATIASAIQRNGGTVEYHEFEGEGHGFRRADTLRQTLELELSFYQRLLSRPRL